MHKLILKPTMEILKQIAQNSDIAISALQG